jgi:hypothetical protein
VDAGDGSTRAARAAVPPGAVPPVASEVGVAREAGDAAAMRLLGASEAG